MVLLRMAQLFAIRSFIRRRLIMKLTIIAGLSVLLLSGLTATVAKADSRVEAQLRLTNPNQPTVSPVAQPVGTSEKTAINRADDQRQNADTPAVTQLPERDRLILQYQTQKVIPVETR
jgi:hypothetical protein